MIVVVIDVSPPVQSVSARVVPYIRTGPVGFVGVTQGWSHGGVGVTQGSGASGRHDDGSVTE